MINEIIGCKTLLDLIGLILTLAGGLMIAVSIEPVRLRYKNLSIWAETPDNLDEEREMNKKTDKARKIRCYGIPILILGIALQILSRFISE